MRDVKKFFWDDLNLYHNCAHVIIRRCMPNVEMLIVLEVCHSSRVSGYHVGVRTHHKFCSLDTICQPYTKSLVILLCLVTVAKERVGFQKRMIFL